MKKSLIFPLSNGVLLYLYIRIKGQTFETNQKKPIMKNLTIIIKQLIKIEHLISPYVAFMIMPLFAFANAGVSLEGLTISTLLLPVPLGILAGLFFGKQIGVMLFSYVSVKFKIAQMPDRSNWLSLYGVSILTGIGFTMSLFVGNLAFVENTEYIDGVKIGVLAGSLLSTLFGYFLLLMTTKN